MNFREISGNYEPGEIFSVMQKIIEKA